jgi:hypothetical protein
MGNASCSERIKANAGVFGLRPPPVVLPVKIDAKESNFRAKESADNYLAKSVESERANDQSSYEHPTVLGFRSHYWQDQSHNS